ncbi:MAG: hypothetical protein RMK31_05570 [Candidatus Caldarchaeum sp.]|nr:hypothetical protein [Candidatus Caldarchaeum sp.]
MLEGTHTMSSDVDILVATDANAAVVHAELWKAGIKPSFEIHVHTHEKAQHVLSRTNTKKI